MHSKLVINTLNFSMLKQGGTFSPDTILRITPELDNGATVNVYIEYFYRLENL